MFTLEGILKFHDWTHASLDLVLDHLSTMTETDYIKELSGFGFPSLRQQVIHIFNCEGFWIHTLEGRPYVDRESSEAVSIADAKLLKSQVRQWTQDYLSGISSEQLNGDQELHFSDGDVAIRTPALILHHVLTHAFHHKGQIAAMCRTLGHPLRDSDLNQFQ